MAFMIVGSATATANMLKASVTWPRRIVRASTHRDDKVVAWRDGALVSIGGVYSAWSHTVNYAGGRCFKAVDLLSCIGV
jgi:hypothetical protein